MKKSFLSSILVIIISLSFYSAKAQKVAGFYPDWESPSLINSIQYDKLTDIYYAFLYPTANGNLLPTTNNGLTNVLAPLASRCATEGVNIHVSIGGANSSGNYSGVVSNSTRRQTFVNDLANIVTTYNLDGVDIDWEFPSGSDAANLTLLFEEIRARFDQLEVTLGKRLYISMAVAPLVWNTDGISARAMEIVDFINLMAFDAAGNCCVCDATNHSSMLIAQRALDKWTTGLASTCGGNSSGKGADVSKIVLSIPFYSNTRAAYKNFSNSNPSGFYNDADGIFGGQAYNSCEMIKDKADLIMNFGGAGLWTWELTLDRSDQYSLLSCMYDAMSPYLCSAPQPVLGNDLSICGLSNINLNSGVSQGAGIQFTWKRGNTVLVNKSSSANTYQVNQAGTYTVEVFKDGCLNSDEIVISGVLPAISLGEDVDLCSPVEATIAIDMDVSGRTIVWEKDNQVISGETGQSIIVNEAGVYKSTVSATGCSSVSDNVLVTSSLPSVNNDTICQEDLALLSSSTSVDWYANQTGGSVLSSGATYEPFVSVNSTFWVEASGANNQESTTLKSAFNSTGWQASSQVYGTKLTVLTELTLKSVDVNANNGTVKINVVEDDGVTVVETKTFNGVNGLQTLTLNFSLSPGTYYLNAVGSSVTLYVDPVEVSDFTIPGILTTSGTTYNDWSAPYGDGYVLSQNYGNFINLVVSSGSSCDRVPVYVEVDPSHSSCIITNANEVKEDVFNVYPNPSANQFTVEFDNSLDVNKVFVWDVQGKLISSYSSTSNKIVFGEDLSKGVYLISFDDSESSIKQKIIKK